MFEKQFVNYAGKKVIKIHLLSHKILLRWRKRSNRSLHPARNGIIFSDLSIFPFRNRRISNFHPSLEYQAQKSRFDCQEVFSAIEKRESFIKKLQSRGKSGMVFGPSSLGVRTLILSSEHVYAHTQSCKLC